MRTMMDFKEIYNDLKPKHKIELALKLNHYVIGKVTLMDITILTAVFLSVAAALKGTSLAPAAVLAITTGLCAVIEFVRIKTRKRKMLQYTLQKAQQAEQLLSQYMTYCERYGSEEEMVKARSIMEMLRQVNEELIRRTEE
ncbi:MAG: hypothetical protein MJY76_09060 [Bacteroidales bacterium]|nr:hypothetical protein [Bacteroidales bacterium]